MFHVATGRTAEHSERVNGTVLIIATEVAGKLVQLRRLYAK